MKKLIFTAALLVSCFTMQIANAQLRINLNLNIGSQPDWGPTGYDHVDYYYMPDVDAYYDVPTHQYVYFENNVWVHRAYLPARYRGYDMYHGYKVVINKPSPWLRNTYYRNTYASYRGRAGQSIIRDSHDARYSNHWNGNNGPGRGNDHHDNGPGRGNDHHDNGPGRGNDHHDNGPGRGNDHHDNGPGRGNDHHDNGNHGGGDRGGHDDHGHGRP